MSDIFTSYHLYGITKITTPEDAVVEFIAHGAGGGSGGAIPSIRTSNPGIAGSKITGRIPLKSSEILYCVAGEGGKAGINSGDSNNVDANGGNSIQGYSGGKSGRPYQAGPSGGGGGGASVLFKQSSTNQMELIGVAGGGGGAAGSSFDATNVFYYTPYKQANKYNYDEGVENYSAGANTFLAAYGVRSVTDGYEKTVTRAVLIPSEGLYAVTFTAHLHGYMRVYIDGVLIGQGGDGGTYGSAYLRAGWRRVTVHYGIHPGWNVLRPSYAVSISTFNNGAIIWTSRTPPYIFQEVTPIMPSHANTRGSAGRSSEFYGLGSGGGGGGGYYGGGGGLLQHAGSSGWSYNPHGTITYADKYDDYYGGGGAGGGNTSYNGRDGIVLLRSLGRTGLRVKTGSYSTAGEGDNEINIWKTITRHVSIDSTTSGIRERVSGGWRDVTSVKIYTNSGWKEVFGDLDLTTTTSFDFEDVNFNINNLSGPPDLSALNLVAPPPPPPPPPAPVYNAPGWDGGWDSPSDGTTSTSTGISPGASDAQGGMDGVPY